MSYYASPSPEGHDIAVGKHLTFEETPLGEGSVLNIVPLGEDGRVANEGVARPPFSLERLSMLADGRVAYLRCMPRRNGATHLVMTPVQLLARLAALIPPPRCPWQRLSGVVAPRSQLRAAVVPSGPVARAGATPTLPRAKKKKKKKKKRTPTPRDNASPRVASAEGTLREGGRASENAAASGPRTSLGDGDLPLGKGTT